MALSCTREMETMPIPEPTSAEKGPVDLILPGVGKVKFTEEMTALVEADLAAGGLRTKSSELNCLVETLGITSMRRLFPDAGEFEPRTRKEGLHRWYEISFDGDIPVTKAGEDLTALPGVEYFTPVRRVKPVASKMNDSYWREMWGLYNSIYGYDIDVRDVWEQYTTGNPDVIVCVVDGGIQLDHPDLAWNCLSTGHYNYVDRNSTIVAHGHGTHVAGTIAAVSNNSRGVPGIAGGNYAAGKRGVSLLSHQVFKSVGNADYAGGFERAIKEGADHGAVISQNSWGDSFDLNDNGIIEDNELAMYKDAFEHLDPDFMEAVDYFIKYAGCDNQGNQLPNSMMKGGVVIFAAGNDDIPYGPPANYEPIIAVGAMQNDGQRVDFSDYGDWVDICAPGVDILSTYTGNQYAYAAGTSMACPHVSGVAALLVSYFGGQGFTNTQLRDMLINGARPIPASSGSKPVGPMVDAYGSFLIGDAADPVDITDFTTSISGNSITFKLTSNGNYNYTAFASTSQEALASLDPANPGSGVFSASVHVADLNVLSGEEVTVRISGLDFETSYYVAMAGANYARRYAAVSPVNTARTAVNNPPVMDLSAASGTYRRYQILDIPVVIEEPDGNAMTVRMETTGRAQLEERYDGWHFLLNCQVSTPGSYTATVVATDEYNYSTSGSITYTILANNPPQFNVPFEPYRLEGAGERMTLDLSEHFIDQDGEPLNYVASVETDKIVKVDLEDGHQLRVTALGQGMGVISLMATDAMGERAQAVLKVLVRPAAEKLSLDPASGIIDKSLTVLTGLTDAETSVRLVTSTGSVIYRHTGMHSAFNPVEINTERLSPGIYTLLIEYEGNNLKQMIVKR